MPAATIAAEIARLRCFAEWGRLPFAYGGQLGSAELRVIPEDFEVIEHSGLNPSGHGEHLLLRVRKTGQNTRWVAKRLADLAGVPYRAVSYAGMKDRHAVTEQWFSIHLPGRRDPLWEIAAGEGFQVLDSVRHDRKLHTGQLSYNRFRLRLRNCVVSDRMLLEERLRGVRDQGVPNYFGPQRFGREQGNLQLLTCPEDLRRLNRETRAFALSALRGALFNGYLASRVTAADWQLTRPDDIEISDRPRGVAEQDDSVFVPCRQPAGLLWGSSRQAVAAVNESTEAAFYRQFPGITGLLETAGCQASRRVLRARAGALQWHWDADGLVVEFALGPGSYATAVLRELLEVHDSAVYESAA